MEVPLEQVVDGMEAELGEESAGAPLPQDAMTGGLTLDEAEDQAQANPPAPPAGNSHADAGPGHITSMKASCEAQHERCRLPCPGMSGRWCRRTWWKAGWCSPSPHKRHLAVVPQAAEGVGAGLLGSMWSWLLPGGGDKTFRSAEARAKVPPLCCLCFATGTGAACIMALQSISVSQRPCCRPEAPHLRLPTLQADQPGFPGLK